MKFELGSDLHLWHGGYEMLPMTANAKLLVLAGDIVEIAYIGDPKNRECESVKYLQHLNKIYDKVIWVCGNHEFYETVLDYGVKKLRGICVDLGLNNFVVLENEIFTYEDTMFFGATMWTTMRSRNPLSMNACQRGMPDYEFIDKETDHFEIVTATAEDTIALSEVTLAKIKDFARMETKFKKVLVTHHAPCWASLDPRFKFHALNDAFAEEIGELLCYSNIKFALHGHVHCQNDYMLDECRVVSNPRGYHGHEPQVEDFKFKTLET
jgi:Icc-related predicted phosphoesterase